MRAPFHLSFTVADLDEARGFYGDVLGCAEGRSAPSWVDFDFFGHQLSLHLGPVRPAERVGEVDHLAVPMPHFGAVLDYDAWLALTQRLRAHAVAFAVDPQVRFTGQPGEQGTFFVLDPSGNALEFKGFRDMGQVFES
jgi:extradiol dioxygenase family protein